METFLHARYICIFARVTFFLLIIVSKKLKKKPLGYWRAAVLNILLQFILHAVSFIINSELIYSVRNNQVSFSREINI